MTDDRNKKLDELTFFLAKQLPLVIGSLARLQASVNVVKLHLATLLTPDSPEESLKQFQTLEKQLLDRDQGSQEARQAADIMEALEQWRRSGGGPLDT